MEIELDDTGMCIHCGAKNIIWAYGMSLAIPDMSYSWVYVDSCIMYVKNDGKLNADHFI